jgi:hypothetical protein
MDKRDYKQRSTVDWYDDESGLKPKHNQKHIKTKKYWNELSGKWCSKKSERKIAGKKDILIYDFKYYPLSKIKEDFGNQYYEKVGIFLTMQYDKQLGTGYKINEWDFIYWNTKDLNRILSYKWVDIIDKLLELKILKINTDKSKYDFGKSVRYFMLSKEFIKVDEVIINKIAVKDERYLKSIIDYYKKVLRDRSGILKHLEGVIGNSSLVIDDIDSILNLMWKKKLEDDKAELDNEFVGKDDKKAISKRLSNLDGYEKEYKAIIKSFYDYLVMIQGIDNVSVKKGLFNLRESSFGGRISHLYSNAPKEFRRYLKIDNEEVVEVDIKASQPSFLYILFQKWYDFNNKHRGIANASVEYKERFKIISGANIDIYKYMILKTKGMKHISDKQNRAEMKKLFYQLIFGNPINKVAGNSRRDLIIKIFGLDFYEFLEELSKGKLGLDKNYKNLSMLLQKEEAGFLNKVMLILIDKDISFLPLYDSLIVNKSDADNVKSVFNDFIEEQGLTGVLKIK